MNHVSAAEINRVNPPVRAFVEQAPTVLLRSYQTAANQARHSVDALQNRVGETSEGGSGFAEISMARFLGV